MLDGLNIPAMRIIGELLAEVLQPQSQQALRAKLEDLGTQSHVLTAGALQLTLQLTKKGVEGKELSSIAKSYGESKVREEDLTNLKIALQEFKGTPPCKWNPLG